MRPTSERAAWRKRNPPPDDAHDLADDVARAPALACPQRDAIAHQELVLGEDEDVGQVEGHVEDGHLLRHRRRERVGRVGLGGVVDQHVEHGLAQGRELAGQGQPLKGGDGAHQRLAEDGHPALVERGHEHPRRLPGARDRVHGAPGAQHRRCHRHAGAGEALDRGGHGRREGGRGEGQHGGDRRRVVPAEVELVRCPHLDPGMRGVVTAEEEGGLLRLGPRVGEDDQAEARLRLAANGLEVQLAHDPPHVRQLEDVHRWSPSSMIAVPGPAFAILARTHARRHGHGRPK